MLSLIEVKCPHCGAHGQIMLPPLGAIIIGPCPECEGMVVVFCGRVLALDKEIMAGGSLEEKRDHLMGVLNEFLQDRIERLFAQTSANSEEGEDESRPEAAFQEDPGLHEIDEMALPQEPFNPAARKLAVPISQDELDSFIRTDLNLLDNKDYFRAVFE